MSIVSPQLVWRFPHLHLGRRVLIFDRLESTNSLALSLPHDPENHGLVLLAREQSAGRGQYGRSWQAPPGSSVLLSVLLYPPPALCRPVLLTAWAAVSVCEVVRQATGQQAAIKWPNDVLIEGKKVCGILIEQRGPGRDSPATTVVGIGLNVRQAQDFFTAAGLAQAASLYSSSGKILDTEEVARHLIARLAGEYGALLEGDTSRLESRWSAHLGLVGKPVRLEAAEGVHWGTLRRLTFELVDLINTAGKALQVAPEAVRHLDAAEGLA